MTYSIYSGAWDSIQDMASDFEISLAELQGVNVLYARYDQEQYEGSAFIMFEKAGKLYEVHGSHCSCYGLEGQWSPEEVMIEELKRRMKTHSGFRQDGNLIVEILEIFEIVEWDVDAAIVAIVLLQ